MWGRGHVALGTQDRTTAFSVDKRAGDFHLTRVVKVDQRSLGHLAWITLSATSA